MADTKISALSAASALAGTEVFPIVQSAATVGATATQMKTFAQSGLATVATSGVYADLTSKPTLTPAIHPGYIVGNWYLPSSAGTTTTGSAVTANSARFIPFVPVQSCTISTLGARVVGAGSTNTQFAIYAASASTHYPTGSALSSTANIANTGAGANILQTLGANVPVTGGVLYWLGLNNGDSSATFAATVASNLGLDWLLGSATQANALQQNTNLSHVSTPLTLGTWGDLTGATWTEQTSTAYGLVQFKIASVP